MRCGAVDAGEVIFAEVGELITELREVAGGAAVAGGEVRLVLVTPLGGAFEKLVDGAQRGAAVTEDGLGDGLKLRRGAGPVQLECPLLDAAAGFGKCQGVGERCSIVGGPAM